MIQRDGVPAPASGESRTEGPPAGRPGHAGRPRDRWSPLFVGLSAAAVLAFTLADRCFDLRWLLPALLAVATMLGFGFVLLAWAFATRRPKRALSALAGLALVAGDVWTLPTAGRMLDDLAFWRNRARYDAAVARQRERNAGGQPLRIVVDDEDRSIFVTTNIFAIIVYDETDRAEADPDSLHGFWPFATSPTGITSVDGPKEVRHIAGHYYRVLVTE